MDLRRAIVVVVLALCASRLDAQVQLPRTLSSGGSGGGGGTVVQGTGGSSAWKVSFGGTAQPVTQSGVWAISFTVPQHVIVDDFGFTPALPVNASTETTALAIASSLADINAHIPEPVTGKMPVSGTFWQTTQPVSLASAPTTPVTGTFWPVTQPVSGTFWQATQPVSLATAPTTPVTGTFWQATQPVSIATLPAGSAVIGHVIADSGSTTAVTGNVTVVQSTGTSLHTVCDSGCGGAASFGDNTAFTFGTSGVANAGYVVDDTSTNAVTENSSGTPRMSAARIAYADLSKSASNANSFKVDFGGSAQPVSGTFWQATQPVSGTFWQATQPVSGTFFQATQPVSLAVMPALVAGSAAIGKLAANSGVDIGDVDVTSLPAITGTVTANAGTNTSTANLDVALSTRLKPADTLAAVTTVGTITNPVPIGVLPTLTKGTQSATGINVQELKDSGRTELRYYAVAAASGATGVETLFTLTKSSGVAATSTGTSFVLTSGKRFRITNVSIATRGHATATIQTTTFNFRVNTAGACLVSSTPIVLSARSATAAVASAWDRFAVQIPEGWEILGDGTLTFCMSSNAVFVTNAPTLDVLITGYEY